MELKFVLERVEFCKSRKGGEMQQNKDLYYIDSQEQVAVHISCFDGIQRDNYFRGEPI